MKELTSEKLENFLKRIQATTNFYNEMSIRIYEGNYYLKGMLVSDNLIKKMRKSYENTRKQN